MADIWYFADGGGPKGPFSFKQLVEVLSEIRNPEQILIWRHGLEEWRPLDQVREIAAELLRPPPLPQVLTPYSSETAGEPSVSVAEAAQFKHVKPNLTGIGGWLTLVAIGQVLAPLRLLGSAAQYFDQPNTKSALEHFPVLIWGEASMNAGLFIFIVITTVLLFRHSRKFPTLFIWQFVISIFLPFVDLAWCAIAIGAYTGRNALEFATVSPDQVRQSIAMTIGAVIWIAYILRSKRVANTFVN